MYTATLSFSLSIAVSRPISFPHSLRDILSLSLTLSLKVRVPQQGLSRVARWVWASLVWVILKTATVTSTAFSLVTAAVTSTTSAHLVTQHHYFCWNICWNIHSFCRIFLISAFVYIPISAANISNFSVLTHVRSSISTCDPLQIYLVSKPLTKSS